MKVILKQDVKGLGKKDDIVEVNDGYARNFLIPKNLAVEASSTNVNTVKLKKQAEENKKQKELENAKKLAQRLSDITIVMKAKIGENGKLFGSITSKEIADKLKELHGIDIDKKMLVMPENIKSMGTYDIEARLYPQVGTKFKVRVEQE